MKEKPKIIHQNGRVLNGELYVGMGAGEDVLFAHLMSFVSCVVPLGGGTKGTWCCCNSMINCLAEGNSLWPNQFRGLACDTRVQGSNQSQVDSVTSCSFLASFLTPAPLSPPPPPTPNPNLKDIMNPLSKGSGKSISQIIGHEQ